MESNDYKVMRCMSPVIIYFFVTLLSQIAVTIFVTVREFKSVKNGSLVDYMSTFRLTENINETMNRSGLIVSLIAATITIGIGIWLMKKDGMMKVTKMDSDSVTLVAAIGILSSAGISKLLTIINIDGIVGSYENINNAFAANNIIVQIITLVFVGPICEEIVFRGLVYNRIKGYTNGMKCVFIQAAVFGVYHFNLVQGLYAFILGVLLAFVYEKYKTFLAPVLLHIFANMTALIMMYLPISDVINSNIILKILVMLLEVGVLIFILVKRSNIKNFFMDNKKNEL